MTKKNKLILIISICIAIVIAITATILIVVLNNRDKWQDVGGKEYTPPSPPPHVPVITYDITVDRGLNEEYYLNQEFDINNVYILYRTFSDGVLTTTESVRCNPAFVKGYPDTQVPDTDTLGMQEFTLNYLGLEYNAAFNVVEYNEKYVLKFINPNTYRDNYSLFVLLERDIDNTTTRTYVDNMKEKLADSGNSIGPLAFMQSIQNIIELNVGGEISGLWGNPDNSSETSSLVKNGNVYNGTMWIVAEYEVYKLVFELEYYPSTKGIRVDMNVNGTEYGVYISSTESTYNMVITGVMAEDVIMTYGADKIYLSTCNAGLYRTIYTTAYDETFGSTGNTVLEYNRNTCEYEMR